MLKKILTILAVITFAIVINFTFSGCANIASKAIEKAVEKQTGVNIDVSSGEVNATDAQGNETNIGGNKVPEGWPDVVPVGKDIKIEISGSNKSNGKTTWNISGVFSGSGEDLYNYYKSQLSSWNVDSDVNSNSEGTKNWTFQLSNDKYTLFIMINDDGKENKSIIYALTEK